MGVLNFQTSRKTYTVNDSCEISFDPADIGFVNRLFDLMEKMDKQNNAEPQEVENVFEAFAKKDKDMRAEIDAVFGEPVCDKVFGTTNVFSPAGGLPLCMNFLLAVIDEVDAASETETKPSARVNAYMQKYEKKYGKYVKK
jgi:hypothetical protein